MNLVIVDDSDSVISLKERDAPLPTDICRVARLVILNSKGQILLAQRALVKKKDPGVWGLAVEGTVEAGEDYESNIRKEAEEEIGIALGSLGLFEAQAHRPEKLQTTNAPRHSPNDAHQ